jgi:hypothetical protein
MMETDNPWSDFVAAEVERITGPLRRECARLQAETMRPLADYVARMLAVGPRPPVVK